LDENQLNELARAIATERAAGHPLAPLIPFRLGILSNATMDLVVPALIATAARHGILLECVVSPYGQVVQSALSPDSPIKTADAILIALDHHGFRLDCDVTSTESADAALSASLEHLDLIRNGCKQISESVCILQTIPAPPERLCGSWDAALPGSLLSLIRALNTAIASRVQTSNDVLLDVSSLAETVGSAEWHSPTQWNLARLPFADAFVPLYCEHLARLLGALRGKSRRCLVLDLDNTLWGGVVGDDGLPGIRCSAGDPTGEAYRAVQQLALEYRRRGVVLAVCSKNSDEIARSPFRDHPDMLLREEHIAVFQANWSDKAANLAAIAQELSLGLESLVLLDDNPVERSLVRRLLPEVAVPELPDDPALYARTLAAAGYFETINLSREDLDRAALYQNNARRAVLKQQSYNLDEYLTSLHMEISFAPFDCTGRPRITQLINKSNQFNLTARRYTEAQVAEFERDERCFTLQVRLSDIYGDNGMICVLICRPVASRDWEIDTWLMSCRVQGRLVENAVLAEILHHARRRGIRKLVGVYQPTERNGVVENHYARLGFHRMALRPDGATIWSLDVATAIAPGAPFTVRDDRLARGGLKEENVADAQFSLAD
jgi:FkbH-like protein